MPPGPTTAALRGRKMKWRFIFTDLQSATVTWANGLQTARQVQFTLGQSATIEMAVWPDDFRVNGIWTDGYPRVAQSNRMIYGFRREGGGTPWVCRAAGILMSPEDEGDEDVPLSHLVAYDARKLLDARPVMKDDGSLLDDVLRTFQNPGGFQPGADIARRFLNNSIQNEDGGDGSKLHIDAGPDWGGTSFWGGHVDGDTAALDLTIEPGQSVGDVWNAIEQAGNCDLILRPIYDPVNRPGYTHELSIYRVAGIDRRSSVFGWDKTNRALNKIDRVHDATPGQFFNKVQYYAGQGGPPVPVTPLVNADSVAAFGSYWSQQYFPALQTNVSVAVAVLAFAQRALLLVKQGQRTLTLDPITERAPNPLTEYEIGDRVVVHATRRLRVTSDGLQRVESLPIQVTDDGVETVAQLLVTPDYLDLTPTPEQQTVQVNMTLRVPAAAQALHDTTSTTRISPNSDVPFRSSSSARRVETVTAVLARPHRPRPAQPLRVRP